jgi:hypothetical protein
MMLTINKFNSRHWVLSITIVNSRAMRVLPAVSALFIALLGLGITTQALMQIGLVKL